ncbi:hypothetical protein [Tropicimonas marinistellae]|uniref:hypothetical protein n=1 Tax=Tropicimonas marinistellae TaxID=1739787 RepID=UPI0008337E84|nr:hypothetical protein [Tropicimonas marinistellae]
MTLLKLSYAMGVSLVHFIIGEDAEMLANRIGKRAQGMPPDHLDRLEATVVSWFATASQREL